MSTETLIAPLTIVRQALRDALDGGADGYQPEQLGDWWSAYQALIDTPPPERARVFAVLDHDGQLTELLAADSPGSANSANSATEEWESFAPFGVYDLPPFPVEALPSWLHAMVVAESCAKQTPHDLAALLALAVLSTCCAGSVAVQPRPGWTEPLNLYTLTALPPGNRKSAVFTAMSAPLVRWEAQQAAAQHGNIAAATSERRVLEAQLQRAELDAAKAVGKDEVLAARGDVDTLARDLASFVVPSIPRLIADDVTPEMLGSLLCQHDGRMGVLSPEGDVFNIMAGRYSQGSPNMTIYLKGHAGDTLRVDRRTRSEYVARPALTFGLTVQPEVLRSLGQKSEFRGLGLLARFLYALPPSLLGRRDPQAPPVPKAVADAYDAAVTHLLDDYAPRCLPASIAAEANATSLRCVPFSPAAQQTLLAFERWLEPQLGQGGELSAIVDWAAKLTGAVARIAGLLHLASGRPVHTPVAEDTVQCAIAIGHYAIPHARAAYAEIGADVSIAAAQHLLTSVRVKQVS